MKKNLILWIALVVLTLTNYFVSDSNFSGVLLVLVIMAATIIKFVGVGFQFMELNDAHKLWKTIFLGILSLFVLLISVAYL